MKTVAFSIPGKPLPLERARKAAAGHMYTPTRSRKYQETVGFHALSYRGAFPECPVRLWLRFYGTKKGDLSNFLKAVEDGLTKVGVWGDDSQVVAFDVRWHQSDENKVEVMIEEVPE